MVHFFKWRLHDDDDDDDDDDDADDDDADADADDADADDADADDADAADAADAVVNDDGNDNNDDDYDDHIADAFEKAHIQSFGNPWSENNPRPLHHFTKNLGDFRFDDSQDRSQLSTFSQQKLCQQKLPRIARRTPRTWPETTTQTHTWKMSPKTQQTPGSFSEVP